MVQSHTLVHVARQAVLPCGVEGEEVVNVGPVLDLRLPGPVVVHLHRTRPNGNLSWLLSVFLPLEVLIELPEEKK